MYILVDDSMSTKRKARMAVTQSDGGRSKKVLKITSETLDNSGKLQNAGIPNSGIKELTEEEKQKLKEQELEETVSKRLYVPIQKVNTEEKTITGVVLQPEIVDAQGDIIDENVIRIAAHKFLSNYNRNTKLGLMHKDFRPQFELYESFIAPVDLVIGNKQVKKGSWIIVIHVLGSKIWKQVKDGKLAGFSIGGKAKVKKLPLKSEVTGASIASS